MDARNYSCCEESRVRFLPLLSPCRPPIFLVSTPPPLSLLVCYHIITLAGTQPRYPIS